MVAFYLIEAILILLLFYLLWKSFGAKIFQQVTHDPAREVEQKLDRVRERMAALPSAEEAAASDLPLGSVEVLRSGYEREERELVASLERLRKEKKRSWMEA